MFRLLVVVFLALAARPAALAQQWKQVLKFEGSRTDAGMAMALTPNDDLLITGIYEDPGGTTLQSADGRHHAFAANQDTFPESHSTLFIARYSPARNLRWSVNVLAENGISAQDIASDNLGNCLVTGHFRGEAIFSSANGNTRTLTGLPPAKSRDYPPANLFLAKYDAAGNLLWLKLGTSAKNAMGMQVQTDAQNNVYLRAYTTYGLISFDQYTYIPKNTSGRNITSIDLVLVKYTPEGKEEWITLGGDLHIYNMQVDAAGNCFLRGGQTRPVVLMSSRGKVFAFDPAKDKSLNFCTLQLNPNGELEQVQPTFPHLEEGRIPKSVTDAAGNHYAIILPESNYYDGHVYTLKWQGRTYKSKWFDPFVAKFDRNLNPIWITQFKGPHDDRPLDILLDQNGNVVVAGFYRASLTVQDITGDSLVLSTAFGYQTVFLASLTPDGLLNWACNTANVFDNYSSPHARILVTAKNELYLTGQLNAPSTFGKIKAGAIGEKGRVDPWWEQPLDYSRYTDGYLAVLDLNKTEQPTVVLNLSLNYKQAKALLAKSLAWAKQNLGGQNPGTSVSETQAFVPVHPPATETNPGATPLDALLYPNPAGPGHPEITVQVTLPASAQVTWRLLNTSGNQLWQVTQHYPAGVATHQFSAQNLPAGLYLLEITTGTSRTVKQLVVQ